MTIRQHQRLVPPWRSWQAKLWWSAVALAVLIVWQYLIVIAAATEWNGTPISLPEAHRLFLRSFRLVDLVYASGRPGHDDLWVDVLVVGPFAAIATWLIVCIKPLSPDARFFGALFMISLPCFWGGWGIPLLVGSGGAWNLLIRGAATAVQYEMAARSFGAAMWTILSVPIVMMACQEAVSVARKERERQRTAQNEIAGLCANCGYSLVGLPTRVCPECGRERLD